MYKMATVVRETESKKLENEANARLDSSLHKFYYDKPKFIVSKVSSCLFIVCENNNLKFSSPYDYFDYMEMRELFITSYNKKVMIDLYSYYVSEISKLKEVS